MSVLERVVFRKRSSNLQRGWFLTLKRVASIQLGRAISGTDQYLESCTLWFQWRGEFGVDYCWSGNHKEGRFYRKEWLIHKVGGFYPIIPQRGQFLQEGWLMQSDTGGFYPDLLAEEGAYC